MKLRELTTAEVTFQLDLENEDGPMDFDSGEPEADEELRKELKARLCRGDLWAWCTVRITARWNSFVGYAYLGCCSYKNEDDFKQEDGYYEQLKEEALEDLNQSIRRTFDKIQELVA